MATQPLDFSGTNPSGTPTSLDAYNASSNAISFREQLPDLASKLREALTTKFNESPLFKQRETAMTNFLAAPSAINADLASMQKSGTILSPNQQQEISGARRAAAFAPLSNTNLMLGTLSGGMENMVSGGVKAFEAASQGMTDRANLMNTMQQQDWERRMKEKEYSLAVQKASQSGTGGLDMIKWLAAAKKPTAGQEMDAINAQSGLTAVNQLKTMLTSDQNIARKANTPIINLLNQKARQYNDTAREAYDVLTRTRTGAALNIDEQTFYGQYIPGFADDKTTSDKKLERLSNLYNQVIQQTENPWMNQLENMMMSQMSNEDGFLPNQY